MPMRRVVVEFRSFGTLLPSSHVILLNYLEVVSIFTGLHGVICRDINAMLLVETSVDLESVSNRIVTDNIYMRLVKRGRRIQIVLT